MARERKCLPAGSKVTCPKCARVMCVSRVDILSGDKFMAAQFESVDAQIVAHTKMRCPFDDEQYCRGGLIHIEGRGWI